MSLFAVTWRPLTRNGVQRVTGVKFSGVLGGVIPEISAGFDEGEWEGQAAGEKGERGEDVGGIRIQTMIDVCQAPSIVFDPARKYIISEWRRLWTYEAMFFLMVPHVGRQLLYLPGAGILKLGYR